MQLNECVNKKSKCGLLTVWVNVVHHKKNRGLVLTNQCLRRMNVEKELGERSRK